MSKVDDLRLPPHNLDAEKSVIGALLIDKDAVSEVAEFLRPNHFYREGHGDIFEAILDLFEKREPVDLITLSEQLKKKKHFEKAGGASYLAELASFVPTSVHVVKYTQIVKDHAIKRQLIGTANKLSELSFSESGDVHDILDAAEQEIFGISQAHLKQNFVHVKTVLTESFDRLEELSRSKGVFRGVATGFADLDKILSGMQKSNLLILAARPGIGKTSFALNIAQFAAVKKNVPVGIFSLEMSKEELMDRVLAHESGVNASRIKNGDLDDAAYESLSMAMGRLAEAPLYIDDTPALSIMEMRTKARRLQIENGLQLLIVDYLQLAKGRNLENRVQEISEISQGLKNLARELNIPVLALSQLSRAVEQRGSKQPQLSDLRESGAIEQDADVVMFIYRDDQDEDNGQRSKEILAKLTIAKHRNGPTGEIDLVFIGEKVAFFPRDKRQSN